MEHMMLQNEIITLRAKFIFLKARSSSGQDFWALVSNEKYPNLKKCVEQLHSCFGSTYLCESAFSYLKQTKSKHRSRLTDARTLDSLRLAISDYKPDDAKLVEDTQTQCSH
ncbi:SCAN domain-containing protein 3 [Eumeta japonica]|uniref:SCAN domain-containing protein 3 n=1 Tax=Eumeta variegata TaxID=151549 RepID=A0A4C1TF87_EUMVA|nr:SCAN domain-containing protein 3 [Eumeta japonica]